MTQKKVLLPILGIALISTLFGANYVSAQDTSATSPSIVQKIAQRFNLSQTDVQKVFDEAHEERMSKMKVQVEERLNQAVKDGKITEAQKQALLSKFTEMMTQKMNHE